MQVSGAHQWVLRSYLADNYQYNSIKVSVEKNRKELYNLQVLLETETDVEKRQLIMKRIDVLYSNLEFLKSQLDGLLIEIASPSTLDIVVL